MLKAFSAWPPSPYLRIGFPEMTIAPDRVDTEMVGHPRRWDILTVRQFMITFGLVSSVFDHLAFGILLLILVTIQDPINIVVT